jgi:hypothetical protein
MRKFLCTTFDLPARIPYVFAGFRGNPRDGLFAFGGQPQEHVLGNFQPELSKLAGESGLVCR